MKRSSILAHRGFFIENSEKNSRCALIRAIEHGFGIETDVRDLNGRIVISHDPPQEALSPPDLKWLLDYANSQGYQGRLALNIKADGLSQAIERIVEDSCGSNHWLFAFDMSVPDGILYLKTSIPVYTRSSEYELDPSFIDMSTGVWIDSFSGDHSQLSRALGWMKQGYRATIISPELHHRDHILLWK